MIHAESTSSTGLSGQHHEPRLARVVATIQGAYFVAMGLWPLFGIDSFQAVTGPKTDLWLVYTVGVLITAIGAALLLAAARRRLTAEIAVVAVGAAVGLAGIDVIFAVRGVLSWVYLLDAAAEVALAVGWVGTLRSPHSARTPRYPRVEALLARGTSVPPNGR